MQKNMQSIYFFEDVIHRFCKKLLYTILGINMGFIVQLTHKFND